MAEEKDLSGPSQYEAVQAWLEDHVQRFEDVASVRLQSFRWESPRDLDLKFDVALTPDLVLKDFSAWMDGAGHVCAGAPVFVSPLGAPASYKAVEFDDATVKAIRMGLARVIPRALPFGIDPSSGRHIDNSTPMSVRCPGLMAARDRILREGFCVEVDVPSGDISVIDGNSD